MDEKVSSMCLYLCVCVRERECVCVREREGERVCVCERESVCVCVCVRERDREGVWVCVCVLVSELLALHVQESSFLHALWPKGRWNKKSKMGSKTRDRKTSTRSN